MRQSVYTYCLKQVDLIRKLILITSVYKVSSNDQKTGTFLSGLNIYHRFKANVFVANFIFEVLTI